MPKGPLVTESVEILIASVYDEHPKWTAMKVQRRVSALLRKHNADLSPDWPGLNSVQKVLAVLRKKSKEVERDLLRESWSIGVSAKYGILPEAIPFVLKVWESRDKDCQAADPMSHSDRRPSIREAKWVSRLCHVIPDDIEALGRAGAIYAKVEELSERLGHPVLDSTGLDYGLMKSSRPLSFDLRAAVEHVRLQLTESQAVARQEALKKENPTRQGGGSK